MPRLLQPLGHISSNHFFHLKYEHLYTRSCHQDFWFFEPTNKEDLPGYYYLPMMGAQPTHGQQSIFPRYFYIHPLQYLGIP